MAADEEDDEEDFDNDDDDTEERVADIGGAHVFDAGAESGAVEIGETTTFVFFTAVAFDGENICDAVGELTRLLVLGFGFGFVERSNFAEGKPGNDKIDDYKSHKNCDEQRYCRNKNYNDE